MKQEALYRRLSARICRIFSSAEASKIYFFKNFKITVAPSEVRLVLEVFERFVTFLFGLVSTDVLFRFADSIVIAVNIIVKHINSVLSHVITTLLLRLVVHIASRTFLQFIEPLYVISFVSDYLLDNLRY